MVPAALRRGVAGRSAGSGPATASADRAAARLGRLGPAGVAVRAQAAWAHASAARTEVPKPVNCSATSSRASAAVHHGVEVEATRPGRERAEGEPVGRSTTVAASVRGSPACQQVEALESGHDGAGTLGEVGACGQRRSGGPVPRSQAAHARTWFQLTEQRKAVCGYAVVAVDHHVDGRQVAALSSGQRRVRTRPSGDAGEAAVAPEHIGLHRQLVRLAEPAGEQRPDRPSSSAQALA